jgi:hypothetical protein
MTYTATCAAGPPKAPEDLTASVQRPLLPVASRAHPDLFGKNLLTCLVSRLRHPGRWHFCAVRRASADGVTGPRRYFLCTDMCLILQYIYYGSLKRRRERLRLLRSSRPRPHAHPHHRLQPAPHAQGLPPYRPLQSEVGVAAPLLYTSCFSEVPKRRQRREVLRDCLGLSGCSYACIGVCAVLLPGRAACLCTQEHKNWEREFDCCTTPGCACCQEAA